MVLPEPLAVMHGEKNSLFNNDVVFRLKDIIRQATIFFCFIYFTLVVQFIPGGVNFGLKQSTDICTWLLTV